MKVENQSSDKECLKINKIYGCLFSPHTLHVCLVLHVWLYYMAAINNRVTTVESWSNFH